MQPVKEASQAQCVLGVAENFVDFKVDIEKLRGRGQVWLLFTHFADFERNPMLNYLDSIGKRQEEFLAPGAMAYLYEL
jgi:hypothetical protein